MIGETTRTQPLPSSVIGDYEKIEKNKNIAQLMFLQNLDRIFGKLIYIAIIAIGGIVAWKMLTKK